MRSSLCSLTRFVAFSLLCVCPRVLSTSGGYYMDNGLQQSVLIKPLENREKHDLQHEILQLLGLHQRPKPRFHDHSSAPLHYLLDVYKALEDEEDPTHDKIINDTQERHVISDSDVIVSFVNKIHHHAPHLRHERDKRFLFDVSEVSPEAEIVHAQLRLYRNLSHIHMHEKRDPVYTLSLYAISEGSSTNSLEMIDQLVIYHITDDKVGWLAFNVTGCVMHWVAFPNKNLGLYLKIKSSTESYDPHELGLVGSKGKEEFQPFMVAYFKTPTNVRIRTPRATRKRQHDIYDRDSGYNPYTGGRDRYHSRRSCERWTLYVSFRDLGWQDFIIAPDGYGAFYCHGECSFPLNAHMNATNHAIVQTLVHLMDPANVPKPCCAPTQLSAITILYFDDNSNVILKKYKNMVVKSCGCH